MASPESIVADAFTEIYGASTTYSTAGATASAILTTNVYTGQSKSGATYYRIRAFPRFNTSLLPDDATVTKVNLKLTVITDASATDFDVQIIEQDWSGTSPISAGNMETPFDACLAASTSFLWRNTSGMSVNTPYTGADMTTSYVSKTGYTHYSLRSSRDYAGTTNTGDEYVEFALSSHATTTYRPTLIVEYTTGGVANTMFFTAE